MADGILFVRGQLGVACLLYTSALAALLHDSAKEISKDEMREILRAYPQYAEGGEERPAPVWHLSLIHIFCVENDLCGTMQSALDELAAAQKTEE